MRSYANIYKHICDGLNKNVLYRLMYLNTRTLDGVMFGEVMELLGGTALLDKVVTGD